MISKSILAVAVAVGISATVHAAESIPVVPASVMALAATEAKKVTSGQSGSLRHSTSNTSTQVKNDSVLIMTPGANQIIPVAVGHPNRIVTPFSNPEVVSTSLTGGSGDKCGEVCIKENVVYVATDKEHPVTMFITEKGSENQALSLTMIPRKVPPREVFLKLDGQTVASGFLANTKAEKWEKSTPYIETIRTVFRKIALGEIPQGYTMNAIPRAVTTPSCSQPGLSFSFNNGQMLMGHSLTVFIGVAHNSSNQTLEMLEQSCGNWDVAAVTSWPLAVLEPGQKTEVYVIRKNSAKRAPTSKRPSLLLGGA